MENRSYGLKIVRQKSSRVAEAVSRSIEYFAEVYEGGSMFASALVRSSYKLPKDNTMIPIEVNPIQELTRSRITVFIPKNASVDAGISPSYEGRSLDLMLQDLRI